MAAVESTSSRTDFGPQQHTSMVNSACLDLLLMEIVHAAQYASKKDLDDERDALFYRLDSLGFRVGQGLTERLSKDRPRFADALDVIKFICKEFWTVLFHKQIDNLKTNHRVCCDIAISFSYLGSIRVE